MGLNLNEKDYNTVLAETADYFAAQGVSIIGEGYREIATNPVLFESYVDSLTEGASADAAANMAQIMANTNAGILRESSMTGIQPIASLSMPVIRKLWPKFALKDAIKTEVAKTPRFVVSYTKPYMFRGAADGSVEKRWLVRDIAAKNAFAGDELDAALRKEYTEVVNLILAAGAAQLVDFSNDVHVRIPDALTPSAVKLQPCDELIVKAFVGADKGAVVLGEEVAEDGIYVINGHKYSLKAGDVWPEQDSNCFLVEEEVKIGHRLGVYGDAVYPFAGGQLIVHFDGKVGKATFAVIGDEGKQVCLAVKAGVSSEYNEESWSVGFDIARQDIDIPTGQHLNAPLPIESLNDMMALYQIDGTKETVDLMTNIFSQKLDLEILDFLRGCFRNQPGNDAFIGYEEAKDRLVVFSCRPAAGFAGSPKEWREELKPLIDHLAQRIKNDTYLQAGTFTLIANPIDVQILANVDWSYRGGQGGNMDGVNVDYSVGTYVGANAYKVVASVNVPAGKMWMIFTPSADTQMTYKYYPYTFSTEMGYVDPNRSRTPSIMMTKRHTMHEFMPAIGCIVIENNDGYSYFNRYVSTKEWSE